MSDIFEISIDTSQLDLLAKDLAMMPGLVQEEATAAMEQSVKVGTEICQEYPDYPGENVYHLHGNNPAPFYSERQKRYFFAALREGIIVIPYPRTMRHLQSWFSSIESTAETIIGHIGTNNPIARWLHSNTDQAQMFESVPDTWQKINVIGERVQVAIMPTWDAAIGRMISKLSGR